MRLIIGIVTWSIVLYQTTFKIAWYQASYLAFQVGTCPEKPKFHGENEALMCLGLVAFLILSIDNLIIMRVMDHD